ncbi:MAG: ABC transporter permease [Bacteroidales bacterium]
MSNLQKGFRAIFVRECKRLVSRPLYIIGIVIIPLFCYFFFTTLMWNGVPERLPVAVVDLDHTKTSRSTIRTLNVMSAVEVVAEAESYTKARQMMQQNEIYAFMVIPEGYEAKTMSGKQPELAFFSNDAYFVAGLFSYKALKMTGALASGSAAKSVMTAKGLSPQEIAPRLQPVVLETNPIGNPWINYSVFINNVVLPAMLELMVLIMTVFALGLEIKEGTSRRLLVSANRSILRVILGKLAPQTILFTLMGWMLNVYLFGYLQFPLANGILPMFAATFLLVVASQAIGVFMIGCLPTLRLGLSFASLFGVVAFSIVGFSLPVVAMYEPFQWLSYLYPIRHYFLIYTDQALSGWPLWYSLPHYLMLVLFLCLPVLILMRLKKAFYEQKYKP